MRDMTWTTANCQHCFCVTLTNGDLQCHRCNLIKPNIRNFSDEEISQAVDFVIAKYGDALQKLGRE